MRDLKRRSLVTGGAGFLGSHLCEALLKDGHHVICLDNFCTGQKENIEHLIGRDDFTLIEQDICEPLDLEVEEIYNLACPASPDSYQKDPIFTTRSCVIGSLNLLELARKKDARILQASTSEVYGDPKIHPQKESYFGNVNPIGKRACYDEGKRCAETLFFDFKRVHDLDISVIRIFNTYGPRMHEKDGRVISNFIMQALKNEPITIYGKGEQTRSFCYVDDLIDAIIKTMRSNLCGPINLGNPIELSIQYLAELIIKMTGSSSKIIHQPLPADDPKVRCPDIRQARKELHWEPIIPISEGLEKTIAYFKEGMMASARNLSF